MSLLFTHNVASDSLEETFSVTFVKPIRFTFQKGRIETALKYDTDVNEAKKLLSDKQKMTSILTTIEKPTKPFNPNKRF